VATLSGLLAALGWRPGRSLLGRGVARSRIGWVVAEVLALTLFVIVLGLVFHREDPLFTDMSGASGTVPWSWFAPALLALRYGVLSGLGSMAMLLAAWVVTSAAGVPMPTGYFIGGLLLTMVCGEFSGSWRGRVDRLAEANSYLEDRIERVTGRLFTVQRSHDLLQQELLQRPTTLRNALEVLERRALLGEQSVGVAAQAFLDHLAASCQLEDAQVVAVDTDAEQLGAVLAQLGEAQPVQIDDALVRYALERGRLAHVQVGLADADTPTQHLVVAPLRIGRQRLQALLVVSRMPFLALHDETLQMIAVLCSAFSAAAEVSEAVAEVLVQVPACPPRLAEELCRLDRIAREHAIVSHLVLLRFDDPLRSEEQGLMAQRRARAPDVTWPYANAQRCLRLLTLMPLAGPASVEGYLASFTEMVTSRYRDERASPGLAALRIGVRVLALGGATPVGQTLRELVAEDSIRPDGAVRPDGAGVGA
jgi:hypothetical protein